VYARLHSRLSFASSLSRFNRSTSMSVSLPQGRPVVIGFSGEASRTLVLGLLNTLGYGLPTLQLLLAYDYRDELEGSVDMQQAFQSFLKRAQASGIRHLYPLQAFAAELYRRDIPIEWANKPGFHDFELPGHGRVQLRA
jgi:hypothetical protein